MGQHVAIYSECGQEKDLMESGYQSHGRPKRETSSLPVRVECHESEDHQWEDLTQLIDVSPFGSRLQIKYPTEPGRLLHLTLPMPRRLRCYDHEEEQYRIWSLVRHVKSLPAADDELPSFQIGVAFIGKDRPPTHEIDPAQRYGIAAGVNGGDFWRLRKGADSDTPRLDSRDRRSEERHDIAGYVILEVYDAEGRVFQRDEAQTENISRHGMAVITNLNIVRGRYIRVRSAQFKIAIIAAVRRLVPVGDNHKNRLHLEFVDQQWPPL
jgi:hypothetical protein